MFVLLIRLIKKIRIENLFCPRLRFVESSDVGRSISGPFLASASLPKSRGSVSIVMGRVMISELAWLAVNELYSLSTALTKFFGAYLNQNSRDWLVQYRARKKAAAP